MPDSTGISSLRCDIIKICFCTRRALSHRINEEKRRERREARRKRVPRDELVDFARGRVARESEEIVEGILLLNLNISRS